MEEFVRRWIEAELVKDSEYRQTVKVHSIALERYKAQVEQAMADQALPYVLGEKLEEVDRLIGDLGDERAPANLAGRGYPVSLPLDSPAVVSKNRKKP